MVIACPAAGPSTSTIVPIAAALELLDLAEHDDVVDARRSGGHDVDHPAADQPLGHPLEAVRVEVLGERVAGGDRLRRHIADERRAAPACRRARPPACAGRDALQRGPKRRLPWSCRHHLCRPRLSGGQRRGNAADPRSSEAFVRRLAIALVMAAVARGRGLGLGLGTAGASTPPTTPTAGADSSTATRASTWRRSTSCRCPGCSTQSSSTRSAAPSTTARPTGSQALVLQLNSSGADRVARRHERAAHRDGRVAAAHRHLGRAVELGARLRPAGPAVRRRRRHRDGAGEPHRLHRRAADLRRRPGRRLRRRHTEAARRLDELQRGSSARACSSWTPATSASRPCATWCSPSTASRPRARRSTRWSTSCRTTARCSATSTLVRFNGLGLLDQLMHTVASPAMAYLLVVIGAALLIFEFFTAGVGIAGFVGAVCLILGCYGLAALPTATVRRSCCWCWRCWPSPSTSRSACRACGPAWGSPCSSSPRGSCTRRSPATTCASAGSRSSSASSA